MPTPRSSRRSPRYRTGDHVSLKTDFQTVQAVVVERAIVDGGLGFRVQMPGGEIVAVSAQTLSDSHPNRSA